MFLIIALLLTCLVYAQQMTNTTSSTSTTAVSSTTTTLPINGTTMDSNSTTTTGGGTPIDVTKLPALAWIVTGGCLAVSSTRIYFVLFLIDFSLQTLTVIFLCRFFFGSDRVCSTNDGCRCLLNFITH
jgi:hypothetical protein